MWLTIYFTIKGDRSEHFFIGSHALSGTYRTPQTIHLSRERFLRLLPDIHFDLQHIHVERRGECAAPALGQGRERTHLYRYHCAPADARPPRRPRHRRGPRRADYELGVITTV